MELWRPVDENPELARVLGAAKARGIPVDPRYELTQHLLEDVIAAAASVEYTVDEIEAIIGRVELDVRDLIAHQADPEPLYGRFLGHTELLGAYVQFNNLLWWLRALGDRICRRDPTLKHRPLVGLLPSLAPGPLAARVQNLFDDLKMHLLDRVRGLSNLSIHSTVLPSPLKSDARITKGGLELLAPDLATENVHTRLELSYEQELTVLEFAHQALDTVSGFMEGLLTAFEEAMPDRLRKAP